MDGNADKTAAQVLIDLLVDQWGVRHIFGTPGDGINPIVEALRLRQHDVQFVQMRHEEAAAFAATGYAKFTRRLGVCLATTGPGGIHLLNGLYDAKLDQVPVLAITGLQYHDLIGQFYQQDVDLDRLMSDVAVYSQRIMGPASVESTANVAVRSALSAPGVSHITMPVDFQSESVSAGKVSQMGQAGHTSTAFTLPEVAAKQDDLQRAADVLNEGARVAILVGAGAFGARAEVEEVAERLGAPIAKALLGKDVLPDDHPYVTGGIGVIGTKPTADAMDQCDTLFIIGSSFPYVSYLPKTDGSVRGVQIDRNPIRVGLRFPVEVGLVGDARATLQSLIPLLKRKGNRQFLQDIQREAGVWNATMEQRRADSSMPMKPQVLADAVGRNLADDALLIGDSGSCAMWISRDIGLRGNQRFSVSGLLASMACGLPYAIGAQIGFPDRQVVAFVGDGGLSMLMGDLATLVKYRLPVKIVVLKNNVLGMIRWEQLFSVGNPEYGVELQDIDFVKIAEGFGLRALRAERPDTVHELIAQAFQTPGPVLVEGVIDPYAPMLDGNVKPQQAEHIALGLAGGEANVERVARGIHRYAQGDVPDNRDTLISTLQDQAGEIMESVEDDQPSEGGEPGTAFESQARTAPERTSGRNE